jgi:hypothetical protein
MIFRRRTVFFLALSLLALGTPASRADSWFKEARQIRREADATEPRAKKFQIVPIFNFTPKLVTAGAFFQDNGERVIVREVRIRASAPVKRSNGQVVLERRERTQHYTGEPTLSKWWREPWDAGYFDYTVTATYKGNVYEATFRITADGAKVLPAGRSI